MNTAIRFYILHGRTPVQTDMFAWANWVSVEKCVLAKTTVEAKVVSTVFLGIDHRFIGEGPPVLFETMVWNERGDPVDCQRFYTIEEAEANHALTVDAIGLKDLFSKHVRLEN